jgi:hypothetical protein
VYLVLLNEATTIPTQYKNDVPQADRDADAYKVRIGSIATEMGCPHHVCFRPNSDRTPDIAGCLKRAKGGNDAHSRSSMASRNGDCATYVIWLC